MQSFVIVDAKSIVVATGVGATGVELPERAFATSVADTALIGLYFDRDTGSFTIPTGDEVPSLITAPEFTGLFAPGEFRKIKRLRERDNNNNAEQVDLAWYRAEATGWIDLRSATLADLLQKLEDENCITPGRQAQILANQPPE